MGVKPSVALRVASLDEGLTTPEIEEMDESLDMMMMGLESGEGATTEGGLPEDNEAGRYGNGSEKYVDASLSSDEGASKPTEEPRSGEEEEKQFKKAEGGGEPFRKAKVYINYPSEAPPGRHVGRGARGGYYYITNVREAGHASPHADEGKRGGGGRRKKSSWGRAAPSERAPTAAIPQPPDLGQGQVKVTGKGVGLVAILQNDKIRAKKLDNDATNKFIQAVLNCGGTRPTKQFECIFSIAERLGLDIKEG
jgi:hypothetical protein